MVDKNKAVLSYLSTCPSLANSPLFFMYGKGEDNAKQVITLASDKSSEHTYIDGSVLKRYTFTIVDYRSLVNQALVNQEGYPNENVEELFSVQSIVNWIEEQNDNRNFPNFGDDCVIDEIFAVTDSPNMNIIDDNKLSPTLAKYSISIRIVYLDRSKVIFK